MQIENKNNASDEFIVQIEKLSNLGYGIAKVDGYVIFVENTCPEDVVKVKITKKNKNFAYAEVIKVIEPSKHRTKPLCPMQKVCGSCQLQFIDYDYQLELKRTIVEDLMRGIDTEIRPVIPSPKSFGYRRKIQYPVTETKNSKKIIAGYYKKASHELINIKYCPIQPAECDEIIDFIRQNAPEYNISGYYEKKHSGILRHVVIRSSEFNNKNLVVLVINDTKVSKNLLSFAKKLYEHFGNIIGVGINFNNKKTNLILGEKTDIVQGEGFIEEKLTDKIFKIGAETFFQVNPSGADKIFEFVKNYIKSNFDNPVILDAYAGISAFGICLSDMAEKVVCVEEVKQSVDMAKVLIEENSIKNMELHNEDAQTFFEGEIKAKNQYDVIVLDPPRKGCTKESLDNAEKLVKNKIVYASCNPSTLARDLKYLIEKGMKVEFIQPFDMFPQTYHIENVAIIAK